jgi:hypothetical protein
MGKTRNLSWGKAAARQRQHPPTFAVRNIRHAGIIPLTHTFATKEVHNA